MSELEQFDFKKLDEGEEIVLEVRKHWLVMVLTAMSLFGFFVAGFLIVYLMSVDFIRDYLELSVNINQLQILLLSSLSLLAFVIFFVAWTDFYLDVWLITNRRLIDIEQKGLFYRDIAVLKLDQVQDVTVVLEGFIPTLFGFGEIRVQTAGTATEFKMTHVANPRKVADIIMFKKLN